MSSTLSTDDMVTELQRRLPIGFSNTVCLFKLNEAFRWVDQNGPSVWRIGVNLVTVNVGQSAAELPGDFDPGRPAQLRYPLGQGPAPLELPFLPFEKALQHNYSSVTPTAGLFHCWSFVAGGSPPINYIYTAHFFPEAAAPAAPLYLSLMYHRLTPPALIQDPAVYFPTPDAYDDAIIDIAEASLKRQYSIFGWGEAQQRAEAAMTRLKDQGRSLKLAMAGLTELSAEAQERQLGKN